MVYCVFFSFIDTGTACEHASLNWTCPGGYIKVHNVIWQAVSVDICNKESTRTMPIFVTIYMKNKCDNTTFCDFTVNDSSLGASCDEQCSQLLYNYECVSKSLVLRIFFFINFSTI